MRRGVLLLVALLLAACATTPSDAPRPDPLWPERSYYNFTGALPHEFPVAHVHRGQFKVRLTDRRTRIVGSYSDVALYAPDIGVVTLVQYGYHFEGADSNSVAVHLNSGATMRAWGTFESTPRRNLLLIDGSGSLYDGGTLMIVRITTTDFERLGEGSVSYSFEPHWASSSCVDFETSGGTDAMSRLSENSDGSWSQKDGRCEDLQR